MTVSTNRLRSVGVVLAAALALLSGCAANRYRIPITGFQTAAGTAIASARQYYLESNKVERDHYIDGQAATKDAINPEELNKIRRSFEGDALVAVAGDGAEHTLFRPSRDVAVRVPEPVHVTAADMVITEAERLRFFSGTDRPHLSDEEALALVAHEVYPNDLGAQVACDPVEVVVVHDLGEGLDDVGEGGHDVHVQPCALRRLPVRREVVGG